MRTIQTFTAKFCGNEIRLFPKGPLEWKWEQNYKPDFKEQNAHNLPLFMYF